MKMIKKCCDDRYTVVLAALIAGCQALTPIQDRSPAAKVKSDYIRSWLICGEFPNPVSPGEDARDPKTPRHAAVSAFGFGGINAHLLFEEWDASFAEVGGRRTAGKRQDPESETRHPVSGIRFPGAGPRHPIAVIGMESQFGSLDTLRAFQEAVFKGDSLIRKRPQDRWKGCDQVASRHLNGRLSDAGYMDEIRLDDLLKMNGRG